jgi:2-oxoglutarate dehydrogenase E2 component (dihydrolipoamide succinyltransferase)
MPVDLVVPQLGESISEAEILTWRFADGDAVALDEIVVELETDKTTVELPSPAAGVLRIVKAKGTVVAIGELLARIEEGSGAKAAAPKPAAKKEAAAPTPASAPVAAATPAPVAAPAPTPAASAASTRLGPAARRAAEEEKVDPASLRGTGPGGRATKSDVAAAVEARRAAPAPAPAASPASPDSAAKTAPVAARAADDSEERVRMSRLRRTIADRLVQAQHTAAILTTFNEIDMSAAMDLRARHKERFEKTHGVSLGFMSIFSRACLLALRDVPVVGARIEGDEVVTTARTHLGIAASTEKGLVVPVVRNADLMNMAELEREIGRLAGLAREGKLAVEDLSGGTFTISNGGVFGSLMSTPILNPPQSGSVRS